MHAVLTENNHHAQQERIQVLKLYERELYFMDKAHSSLGLQPSLSVLNFVMDDLELFQGGTRIASVVVIVVRLRFSLAPRCWLLLCNLLLQSREMASNKCPPARTREQLPLPQV